MFRVIRWWRVLSIFRHAVYTAINYVRYIISYHNCTYLADRLISDVYSVVSIILCRRVRKKTKIIKNVYNTYMLYYLYTYIYIYVISKRPKVWRRFERRVVRADAIGAWTEMRETVVVRGYKSTGFWAACDLIII